MEKFPFVLWKASEYCAENLLHFEENLGNLIPTKLPLRKRRQAELLSLVEQPVTMQLLKFHKNVFL